MSGKQDELLYTVMSSAGPVKLETSIQGPPNTSENIMILEALERQEEKDTEQENRYIII